MEHYRFNYSNTAQLPKNKKTIVGVAGSGNLEVIVQASQNTLETEFVINTNVAGFENTWRAVIEEFNDEYKYGGLIYTLNDAGATPPVVALRLRQAIESYQSGYQLGEDYLELSARTRIYSLVDKDSFQEFLLNENCASVNLPNLNLQTEEDDGVVIGVAKLENRNVAILAQQKDFIGGSVGEIHGAKIIGLIDYATKHKLEAIIFLIDSGGVRLHEANVGEIEISEIIRSICNAKSKGIKTIGVVCGNNGAYGGMGIISGCLDYLIMNEVARIGVSGAEVIQAVKGKEVFDSSDRALIWRVYGGRTRYLQQAINYYTTQKIAEIRDALLLALTQLNPETLLTLKTIEAEHKALATRIQTAKDFSEQGTWLEHFYPNLMAEDPFNSSDNDFKKLAQKINSGNDHGQK